MQHKNFCRAKGGNAAMNAGWRTSLKTFLSAHFFKDILFLSLQILIYSHDASINCAIKQEVIYYSVSDTMHCPMIQGFTSTAL